MSKRSQKPYVLGSQWRAGDVAVRPPGTSVEVNNLLVRAGRLAGRPPFTYDGLPSITGLANFDDPTNKRTRLVAVDASHHFFEKATSGEAWSASLGSVGGIRVSDSCNYLGKVWLMLDDANGLPSAAASFDGTTLSTTPFTSAIQGRTVTPYGERLVIAYPRATFTNIANALNIDYSATSGFGWSKTNVTGSNVGVSGSIIGRMFPTNIGIGACYMDTVAGYAIAANTAYSAVWLAQLRGVDPTYRVPFTMEWRVTHSPIINHAYALGELMSSGGYLYSCTTAGTSAAVAPAYGVTRGGVTADNTVNWTNIGTDVVNALEDFVPSASDTQDFTSFACPVIFPAFTNTVLTIGLRFKFFNSTSTSLTTLAPVDFSFKDGLADGDPRKANHGQQVTEGEFGFPFFNQESSATTTVDLNSIIVSEIRQPKSFRAVNDYRVNELIGFPTAAAVNSKRYIAFWQNGFAQFISNTDDNFPLRLETTNINTGCLGPLALDTFQNVTYFIAEDDIYAYSAGSAPQSITGDGMRETIMDHSSATWVNGSAFSGNRPILKIDQLLHIIYAYTQRGKLFAFNLLTKAWSTYYVSNGAEINAMAWNKNTGHFYVSFAAYGVALLDYSLSANDSIDGAGAIYPLDMNVVHIIESETAERTEQKACKLLAFYRSDISQSGQEVTVGISFDQGATYPHSVKCTPVAVSTGGNYLPLPIPLQDHTQPSITLKIARSGKGGETSWSLSPRLLVEVEDMSEERIRVNPVAGAVT